MKKEGYYSSGQFAKMAHVTLRTIRYYDKHNILKPSLVTESGVRFYTDQDFARLQQILLLKYVGFSLEDIREMTIADADMHSLEHSMEMQLKLVRDKIEQMQAVEHAIVDIQEEIQTTGTLDWNQTLNVISLMSMENSLKNQYQNASNISARINLHQLYSENQQGWFPWIFAQCNFDNGMRVLETGCGDGSLWTMNYAALPQNIEVTLSDISEGMIRDARRAVGVTDKRFHFETFGCNDIPYPDASFDMIIANHVLFYCDDVTQACQEIQRVLRPGGIFICSTYGKAHMKEVSQLVQEFDDRIVLSADKLYEKFGRENGQEILQPFFTMCKWRRYDDSLLVTEHDPLITYILSCHGNQKQYILDRHKNFQSFVKKKVTQGFRITKDAGIFYCEK